jgi:hypothetical protein
LSLCLYRSTKICSIPYPINFRRMAPSRMSGGGSLAEPARLADARRCA